MLLWSSGEHLALASGTGRKGPGADLAQVPGWLSPSEDIDGCVCQVMGSLRAEAYFPIHTLGEGSLQ